MAKPTEPTEKKQRSNLKPFKPGQSGNPAGRPKGTRNKLSENFVARFTRHPFKSARLTTIPGAWTDH